MKPYRFLALLALLGLVVPFASVVAQPAGEVTCETPQINGAVRVVSSSDSPADDIALVRIDDADLLATAKVAVPGPGPGDSVDECIMGPVPPDVATSAATAASGNQAYIEHGLAVDSSWLGFAMTIVLPAPASPEERTQVALLAVDFDTAEALGDQYRVVVERGPGSSAGELLLQIGESGSEVARLPLPAGEQRVWLAWPTDAAPGAQLTVSVAGSEAVAPLPAGSRARAVRVGYLGLSPGAGASGQLWLRNPVFVTR